MNYRTSFLFFLLRILTGLLLTFLPKVEILLLMIEEFDPKTEANNVFQIVIYVSTSWTVLQGCWHMYSFLLSSWKNAIKHQVISIQLRALGNVDLFILIIVFAALNENNAFGGNGAVSSQSLLLLTIGAFTEQLRGTLTLVSKDLYHEVLLSLCRALGQAIGTGVLPELKDPERSASVKAMHETMDTTISDALGKIEAGAASFLPESFTSKLASLASYHTLKTSVKDAAVETGKDYIPEGVTNALVAYDDLNDQYKEYMGLKRKGDCARALSLVVLVISFISVVVVAAV